MRRTPSDEARGWFLQAQRDLDDARYSAAGGRFNLACFLAPPAMVGGPLDKYYIPTRYPNGLPAGIPSDAFVSADAQTAIPMAEQVLDTVSSKLTS